MGVMLYREGKGTRVWGKQYKTTVVSESDIASYLADGWCKHPDEVDAKPVETAKIKRTRKTSAEAAEEPQEEVSDESDNEG
ncbi:hypothetical protein AAH446_16085 [Erwinia sp. P6884]|uniref:hypothetical protein n=1 Tax=Erwinia sp. P6884 TaxID=3141450 RepID=UPI0031944CFC